MATPVKSVSALDLTTLQFTETPTTLAIYNHAATSNQVISRSRSDSYKIGITFGQTAPNTPADPLQWLDPTTGLISFENITAFSKGTNSLTARAGHTLVQYGSNLWGFGGSSTLAGAGGSLVAPTTVPDTPTIDLSAMVWYNQTRGLPRYGHASAPTGNEKIVSCYGIKLGTDLNDDCVFFSVSSKTYAPATLVWNKPADAITGGLIGHTIVAGIVDTNILYLFGGTSTNGTVFYNNIYRLDTSSLPKITIDKITQPPNDFIAAAIPSPRAGHAAVVVGTQFGAMVVHGGRTASLNNTRTVLADPAPYFFMMGDDMWIDSATFKSRYLSQKPASSASVVVIIIGILAGVVLLGAGVAYYIWKGIRDDELERLKKEAEAAAGSPTLSTIEDYDLRKSSAGERKSHNVYPLGAEDVSLANGPFKSTTSLIQPEEYGKKSNKKKVQREYEPYSPGGTTLTENGSMNEYYSSASSSTPSRLNKNNSNGSSQYSRQSQGAGARSGASPVSGGESNGSAPGDSSYYNSRDLYLEDQERDDDDSSISMTSEATMSPWSGPLDLAPPNPRFSRGAIPQAHRQLVGAVSTHNTPGNRYSSGWDTSSPGGSLSSREDGEFRPRSVNSMQWVSFDPSEMNARPDSGIYDPQSQRSLTVRNASMYGNSRGSVIQSNSINYVNNGRISMYGGSNTSDTNTEDSGSYYSGPGGKRISTALAARQQRRSMRNSQDSQNSISVGNGGATGTGTGTNEDPMVTKVLPVITTKVAKPTIAKVVNNPHQRGSRVVLPSVGPLGERRGSSSGGGQEDAAGGLGIDFSRFGDYNSSSGGGTSNRPNVNQGRRGSSTLNPGYNKNSNNNNSSNNTSGTATKRESRFASSFTASNSDYGPNVVLRMPPPPKHDGRSNESQQPTSPGLRESIMVLGQDMPGFLNYGDN
ncbi:hypothetical protein BGX26_010766 [Mortierella sp. AD094]|nr:hypothetical protein BGX26_010766 [Mortierella sp. AD094]